MKINIDDTDVCDLDMQNHLENHRETQTREEAKADFAVWVKEQRERYGKHYGKNDDVRYSDWPELDK